jgi:two-component system, OmpR family, response regulator VanR
MDLKKLNNLKLLYIENNEDFRKNYLQILSLLFKKVFTAENYESALNLYEKNFPDIIVVDINLEGLSGLDLVQTIRKTDLKIPIVFLTAYQDTKHLLQAANLQIDAYIVKPLDFEKLGAAMFNCLKKISDQTIVKLDTNLSYNLSSRQLYKNDKIEKLGKKLNILLYLFVKNANKTITREEIEYRIWDTDMVTDSAVKNLIGNLRKKIGKEKIVNIMGIGYKLNIE